ncbi:MAG: dephospho-CoA kinase [Gallicola sp.]|nr:dephospho-CoA kinase [Gallicola sp.]
MMPSKRIGLTGGIASGKSTVSRYLEEKGLVVIDADRIAHDLYDRSFEYQRAVVKEFGEDILVEGKIDRKILGGLVFKNSKKRKKLEEIAHPLIFKKIKEEVEKHGKEKAIFLDIPLLFEVDPAYREDLSLDEIWLVSVSKEKQLERLMNRDQISEEEALRKIQTQMDLRKKIELSDVILYNNMNVDFLYMQVDNQLRDEGIL